MEFSSDWERLSDEESDDSSLGCVKSDDEESMPDLLPYEPALKIERERNHLQTIQMKMSKSHRSYVYVEMSCKVQSISVSMKHVV